MLTRRILILCGALLVFGGWALQPLNAAGSPVDTGAAKFVENLGNQAIETLGKSTLSKEEADRKFRDLLHKGFDVPTIGQFVLGRYWPAATAEQRQEYLKLFESMIVQVYADRFRQYSGETFKITGSRPEGDNDAFVSTQILRPSGPPVNVEWRVRKKGGEDFKIIDVVVEGVSMSVTQRSEFASVIQGAGGQIEGLLKVMRQKAGQGA